ncbi:MAG TPA: hexose kinase [Vicinamibacteria bacterium]
MILVVSPNLAVDVTLEVELLKPGEVHRARGVRRQAGGKGVNFARALRSLGPLGLRSDPPLVLGFASGRAGEAIREGLASEEIASELVPFGGENRTCTIVLDAKGEATVVNEAGPTIEDASELLAAYERRLEESRAVAFMGSLPPGLSCGVYAEMIARARKAGRWSLLDTSGEALRRGLDARPSLAKPNRVEAEALLGVPLASDADRRNAVERIRSLGASIGVVTFGKEGFLIGDEEGSYRTRAAVPSDIRLGNPTGAGDALAAGLLAGAMRGYPISETARLAAAAAAASLAEGYGRFRAKDVRVEAARSEKI